MYIASLKATLINISICSETHPHIAFIFAGCHFISRRKVEENDSKNIPITDSERSATETGIKTMFSIKLNISIKLKAKKLSLAEEISKIM